MKQSRQNVMAGGLLLFAFLCAVLMGRMPHRSFAAGSHVVEFLPVQQWGFGPLNAHGLMVERCIMHIQPNGKMILELREGAYGPDKRFGCVKVSNYKEWTVWQPEN